MNSDMPQIKLFNTLSKSKEDFVPLDANNVRMYVCGPTVYDYAHIGNARPAIVFDVLFRLLRHVYGKEHVTYVRNITDVDDKINARAARDFPQMPLNEAIRQLTKTTQEQYQADMKALGCLPPDEEPRATDNIVEMVEMIEVLIEKKHAYVKDGHVLFDVKSYQSYGALARRSLDDMIAGARVEPAKYKRDPMDFVLWKPSANDEPGWDSPWGTGRPGWHIECSAMSKKFLGETFDIHGGGIDLSFPHHENELAQSCCANDTERMAQVWMHNGFLQVEGEKMSKSEGNFFTVDELLHTEKFGGRKWPGAVLRLAMLMTHYRQPIDFSVARLEEAANLISSWRNPIRFGSVKKPLLSKIQPPQEFMNALIDDVNTVRAIGTLHELVDRSFGVEFAAQGTHSEKDFFQAPFDQFYAAMLILGIDLYDQAEMDSADVEAIEASISDRLRSLAAKDFVEADRIRDELAEQGIQLMDYIDPDTSEKRTKWEVKR